ncbi:CBS domain-containing protein [Pelomicrobium sp.]|jgi:CBS domain-containing protein|uniref:CBS domain-containing protein n=1 Tax=Pelomicrobium sp. TaxID=2815319 RepID=UPI002FDCF98D
MDVGEICTREVVIATRNTTVVEAARLMREYHVGDLVVVDESEGRRVPVGIVTDRDIVVGVLALGLDPAVLTVGDIMGSDLVTAAEDDDVYETLQIMRTRGVRRVPVVNTAGALVGIVALDDILEIFAEELDAAVKVVAREQANESQRRR